ncbi:MAG: hypothetical protein ACRDQH_16780 [Pseudonocardiaceae bacterium]
MFVQTLQGVQKSLTIGLLDTGGVITWACATALTAAAPWVDRSPRQRPQLTMICRPGVDQRRRGLVRGRMGSSPGAGPSGSRWATSRWAMIRNRRGSKSRA